MRTIFNRGRLCDVAVPTRCQGMAAENVIAKITLLTRNCIIAWCTKICTLLSVYISYGYYHRAIVPIRWLRGGGGGKADGL